MIEIKELIIRATVDSVSANNSIPSDVRHVEASDTDSIAYLESMANQLKNSKER